VCLRVPSQIAPAPYRSITGLTQSAFLPSAERYFTFFVCAFPRYARKSAHRKSASTMLPQAHAARNAATA
jgi:hypothetical protein